MREEMKHSPSPWTCEGRGEPVKDANGEVVALVYAEDGKEKRYYWECGMANRHLIASAPDLLAALDGLSDKAATLAAEVDRQQTSCPLCGGGWGEGEDALCGAQRALNEAVQVAVAALARTKGEG